MHPVVSRWLIAGGLVTLTGPLSFPALAQYVDLEAERAAAEAAGRNPADTSGNSTRTTDPYGAQPAQAYPATSYGAGSAPAAPTAVSPVSNTNTAAPPASAGGSELGNMYLQMQQLQQEVMRLNGRVEELSNEVTTLRDQSLQRYMDLDKRIGGASPAAPGAAPVAGGAAATGTATATNPPPVTASATPGVAQPGEAEAYQACYALVQGRKFDEAITAFKQFLQRYPDGQYAANAHYWLGELYLVLDPPDLEAARQSFALLLSQYPNNSKAPDALYKLGKVQFLKGNREKAREYLDLVITQYQGTDNAVVKLAQDFIDQNY